MEELYDIKTKNDNMQQDIFTIVLGFIEKTYNVKTRKRQFMVTICNKLYVRKNYVIPVQVKLGIWGLRFCSLV